MTTDKLNTKTLSGDMEILIGRAFEDNGKKKRFLELQYFFDELKKQGYSFNFIRELKQPKAIPFKKFASPITGQIYREHDLKRGNKLMDEMAKATKPGSADHLLRDNTEQIKGITKSDGTKNETSNTLPSAVFYQKTLKTHVVVEHRMIHIYLITRQDKFADKVQTLASRQPSTRKDWLKRLVGYGN
ncbi:MAG: hypothetical protein QM786_11320 [Breznakibacter sp.]